jgi:hypothetical protein
MYASGHSLQNNDVGTSGRCTSISANQTATGRIQSMHGLASAVSQRWPYRGQHQSRRPGFPRETDCVAGHVGFELRCAERKFISLTCLASSDSDDTAQTAAVPRENADRTRPLANIASGTPSGQPASHRSSNLLTQAGRIRTSMRRERRFISYKQRLAAMFGSIGE